MQPWVHTAKEEMLNGHNRDVPPQLVLPMVEKLETSLVQFVVPSGLGEFTLGGPQIFIEDPQYHWHSLATAGANAEAWEHLMALEGKVFAFGQYTEECEVELLAKIVQLEV